MGKEKDTSTDSFSLSSFVASVKNKVSPPIFQAPGTASIGAGELKEAGIDIKKGDSRLKKGIMRDDLSFNELKKLESARELFKKQSEKQ